MCGGGIAWTYKPTPQPGDFVKAKVCPTCGKRTKRPKEIYSYVSKKAPSLSIRTNDRGEVAHRKSNKSESTTEKRQIIHTCCSLATITVYGRVERTLWSHHKNGVVKSFFLVVFVPSLGKRHWATLETVELVAATDYLIQNVPADPS